MPLLNVTVNVAAISGDADLSVVSGDTLTFSEANWNVDQQVTIRAAEDVDLSNGLSLFEVTSAGVTTVSVTANEVDNDVQSLLVSSSTVSVNEGSTNTFTVRLAFQPAGDVTVNVARVSGDTDLSVSGGGTLTFTSANWNTPQIVTMAAAEDADFANGSAVMNVTSAGLTTVGVTANEVDNDVQSLIVSSTSVAINEGSTNTFTVRLSAQPAMNVTVNVGRSSGDTDLTVSGGATLTFTSANWNTPQTVTLAAAEDVDLANGSAAINVTSAGLTTVAVTANEVDNDAQSLVVSSTSVSVNEGTTNTFTVRLAFQPAGDVTVNVARASGDADLSANSGGTLTFTSANWNTPQTVTLAAAEDVDLANGSGVFNVTSTGLTTVGVTATEADNDVQSLVVSSTVVSVNEGATNTFTVRLAFQPAGDVTGNVARASGDADLSVTGGGTLTFTSANWNTAQTVTLTATEDADFANGAAVINVTSAGVTTVGVTANEVDNDVLQSLVVSSTNVSVNEGSTNTFTVRLAAQPATNVTVSVIRASGDTDLSVSSGGTLTFTSANWNVPQTVTLAASEDVDAIHGVSVFSVVSSGVAPVNLTAAEVDNDPAALTVNIIDSSISENGAYSLVTITRNSSVTTPLAVTLTTSNSSAAIILGGPLTIPAGQTSVTGFVSAVEDLLVDGTQVVAVTATAEGHLSHSDTVDVIDDDTATVSIASFSDVDFFVSADGTATGGAVDVKNTNWLSHRFYVDAPLTVSSVGGTFASKGNTAPVTLFAAITALSSSFDYPDSPTLTTSDVLKSTTFSLPGGLAGADVSAAMSITLNPGWYCLTFGTGGLGAPPTGDSLTSGVTMIGFNNDLSPLELPFSILNQSTFLGQTLAPRFFVKTAIPSHSNGNETGPVNGSFTVRQSVRSTTDTVVSYSIAGTSTSGSDFSPLTGTVTIPAGSLSAVISVPVIDDSIVEGTETLQLTLTGITSSNPGITLHATAKTDTINILDNDVQSLVVSSTNVSVNEASTNTFTVRLAAQPAANVTVNVARTSGDVDLTVSAAATLTFTSANWNIPQNVTLAAAEDTGQFNPIYSTDYVIRLNQPVLRGGGRKVALAPIKIAQTQSNQARWELEESLNSQIRSITEGYWRLYAAHLQVQAVRGVMPLAEESVRIETLRLKADRSILADVSRARVQVDGFRRTEAMMVGLVRKRVLQLRQLMGGQPIVEPLLLPSEQPLETPPPADISSLVETARQSRPALNVLRERLSERRLVLGVAENAVLPSLDLRGDYWMNGLSERLDDSFSQAASSDYTDWTLGFGLDVPLGNKTALSRRKMAELALAREQMRLMASEQSVAFEVTELVSDLQAAWQRLEIAKQQAKETEEWLRVSRIRYTQPPAASTSQDWLLLALTDLQAAMRSRVEAITNVSDAIADYNTLLAELQQAQGISVYEWRQHALAVPHSGTPGGHVGPAYKDYRSNPAIAFQGTSLTQNPTANARISGARYGTSPSGPFAGHSFLPQ